MFEIGSSLTEARLKRGLDVAECELQTKIRAKYLRAMENDEFDALPAPAYIRGFLRSYAEFLGLDGDLMLDEYESRQPLLDRGSDSDSTRRRAAPSVGRPPRGRGRRRGAEGQLLAAALTAVLSVSALVWVGVSGSSDPAVPIAKARVGAKPPVTDGVSAAARETTTDFPIVVRALAPQGSYLQVRSVNKAGRTVFDGFLSPGEEQRFRVRRGLWMTVGRTDGVALTVDGNLEPLAGGTASFQLSRAGVVPTQAGG